MPTCVVCGKPALYFEFQLHGMACTVHASPAVQVAAVRSLASALLKSIDWEGLIDTEQHTETAAIIKQLRPLLKD